MKKKTVIIAQGLCMLLFVALTSCSNKKQGQQAMPNAYPMQVISTSNQTLFDRYPASIEGKQNIAIIPQVSGQITKVCVEEGAAVKKGQALFIIDQVPFEAAVRTAAANVNAARAAVATAKLNYTNNQALYKEQVISESTLLTVKNTLASAEAALAQAEAAHVNALNTLSYSVVKAPSAGVVSTINYRVGALVGPTITTPLTYVSDNSEMYVYFAMADLQRLKYIRQYGSLDKALAEMPEVTLELADESAYDQKGKIESISGIVDSSTGQVQFRASFPNPDRLLTSGGNGTVIIPSEYKDVIEIPQSAIFRLQDKVFVYLFEDGQAKAQMVTLAPLQDGKNYIVTEGLKAGQKIVSEGAGLLRPGLPITEAKARPEQGAAAHQTAASESEK